MPARPWIVPVVAATMAVLAARSAGEARIGHITADPLSATAVQLCWSSDTVPDRWTIRQAAGPRPPRADARPVVSFSGTDTCRRIGGLRTDRPYTWSIEARDADGDVIARGRYTGAARLRGPYVTTRRGTHPVPGSDDLSAVALAAGPPGIVHVASGILHGDTQEVHVVSRSRGRWSHPVRLVATGEPIDADPLIAATAEGTVVVAWNFLDAYEVPSYRVRAAGRRRWGPVRRLDGPGSSPADHLDALAVDRSGHLHALVSRDGDLHYVTNATGAWTDSAVAATGCRSGCVPGALAYDAIRDRVVVVANGPRRVTIADKPAGAADLGRARALTGRRGLFATSVAAAGGTVTVGFMRPGDGLFVMAGDGPAHVGTLTRVPGTDARDVDTSLLPRGRFLVAAAGPDRVIAVRQRDTIGHRSWNSRQQGIWSQVRERAEDRWRFAPARHLTSSAYDVVTSLTAAGGGTVGHLRR